MQKQYWSNIRNQRTPAPTPQQAQPAPQQGLGIRRPQGFQGDIYTDPNGDSYDMSKASVFDIDLGKFFADINKSQDKALRQVMRDLDAADRADVAEAAAQMYAPGEGYGIVEPDQPGYNVEPF
jgi:hypothetical protein